MSGSHSREAASTRSDLIEELALDLDGIKRRYGGLDVKGNNIIFSNGEKDPWKMLSILNASLATRTSTAGTFNGGHVVPEDGSGKAEVGRNARTYEIEMLKDWRAQGIVPIVPVSFKFTDHVVFAYVVTIGLMVVVVIAIVIVR
ncbi:hypothetical protein BLNAU_18961 [Blattamonas nauphoetae]|uniref:Uncharacterized protein n=1 Tax=Blattamonas nauphoetae TaxID=2049346 RepID=A0ABQ9X469_9EUKA|nr:hypothetical protein BLNAU_18961 [Blattamonas nauphoetae]